MKIIPKKAILWMHPRSMSTAVERAFIERGDSWTVHHPFALYKYGNEPLERIQRELLSIEETNPEYSIHHTISKETNDPNILLVKDAAYNCAEGVSDRFLESFIHIFILRNPHDAVSSLYKVDPDELVPQEIGYRELLNVYNRITKDLHNKAFIIIAEDLVVHPEIVLRALCRFMVIDYKDEMLNWSHREMIPSWKKWMKYHDTVLNTKTIKDDVINIYDSPLYPSIFDDAVKEAVEIYNEFYVLKNT